MTLSDPRGSVTAGKRGGHHQVFSGGHHPAEAPCRGDIRVRIVFEPVPARCLPVGVLVSVTEGDDDVVYLVNDSASLPQICAALSTVTTEYASQSWLHVGSVGELEDAV